MKTDIIFRIKKIREYRNYTQNYVAIKLGISQNTYSKIESGVTNVKPARLEKIAEILGVPIDCILNDDHQLFNLNTNNYNSVNKDVMEYMQKTIQIIEDEVKYLREQNMILINVLGEKIKGRR